MTPEAQQIAIAEACGYSRSTRAHDVGWKRSDGTCGGPPDYLNDLDAMHKAEKVLTPEQQIAFAVKWLPCVLNISGRLVRPKREEFKFVSADAAQRAEAFLRTIGKWEEAP